MAKASPARSGTGHGARPPDQGTASALGRAEVDDWASVAPSSPPTNPSVAKPRRRRRHMGLRARVTTTFALGALVLSGSLATITYLTVRSSILNQEQSSLTREAVANAEAIAGALETPGSDALTALQSFGTSPGSQALLEQNGSWYSSSNLQPSLVPAGLRSLVLKGHLSDQIVSDAGTPELVVGVPMKAVHSATGYFQVFSLDEESKTLRTLSGSLVLAAVVTILGGAVVGRWGASRALKPLHETARAALSIAGGRLDTRLRVDDYADLAVLTSAFNQMADGLQERIERERRFTSDVNHELRSPLTTLATSLSVLEGRRHELPERSQKALDLLSAEVRRFRRLVDDLLEISRLDAGLGDLNAEEVALGPLVEYSVRATGYNVMVDIPRGVEARRVVVDKRRFERIMANLIENAAHYGGGATRVAVEADAKWGRVVVEDRGPGIPSGERSLIFNRFSRGSNAKRRGAGSGTGLGLAIVLQHATVLGGRVWVEANGSRGSRFVVELPLQPPSVSP